MTMRNLTTSILFIAATSAAALAQPAAPAPAPAPVPTPAPDTATPDGAAPAEVKAEEPVAPVAPTPEPVAAPAPVVTSAPVADAPMVDTGASTTTSPKKPRLAIELSGTGSYTANPYLEYRGWTMETGTNKGGRFEANLIGIQIAYELSSMSNSQACGAAGCMTGDYGSTTIHAFELGYRLRLGMMGPVRPFVAASLGAVLASSGDWSPMTASTTAKGGAGRLGFGVEYPVGDQFFVSASLAYRILVTTNPLRDLDAERAQKALVGGTDIPTGDYAEDLHLVSAYLGFGVSL